MFVVNISISTTISISIIAIYSSARLAAFSSGILGRLAVRILRRLAVRILRRLAVRRAAGILGRLFSSGIVQLGRLFSSGIVQLGRLFSSGDCSARVYILFRSGILGRLAARRAAAGQPGWRPSSDPRIIAEFHFNTPFKGSNLPGAGPMFTH